MSEVVGSFGGANAPILVSLSEFEGVKTVDIRKHYKDKATGELRPTAKGIALRQENLREFLAVLSENEPRILGWFLSEGTATGRVSPRSIHLSQPLTAELQVDSRLRGSGFFECAFEGPKATVSISKVHPVCKSVSEPEVAQFAAALLSSFEVALTSAGVANDQVSVSSLKLNWGLALKHILMSAK